MKKFFITLSMTDQITPAGLLFSFLLGVFVALLYFAMWL